MTALSPPGGMQCRRSKGTRRALRVFTYELEVRLLSRNERHDGQLFLRVAWMLVGKFELEEFKDKRRMEISLTWLNVVEFSCGGASRARSCACERIRSRAGQSRVNLTHKVSIPFLCESYTVHTATYFLLLTHQVQLFPSAIRAFGTSSALTCAVVTHHYS